MSKIEFKREHKDSFYFFIFRLVKTTTNKKMQWIKERQVREKEREKEKQDDDSFPTVFPNHEEMKDKNYIEGYIKRMFMEIEHDLANWKTTDKVTIAYYKTQLRGLIMAKAWYLKWWQIFWNYYFGVLVAMLLVAIVRYMILNNEVPVILLLIIAICAVFFSLLLYEENEKKITFYYMIIEYLSTNSLHQHMGIEDTIQNMAFKIPDKLSPSVILSKTKKVVRDRGESYWNSFYGDNDIILSPIMPDRTPTIPQISSSCPVDETTK